MKKVILIVLFCLFSLTVLGCNLTKEKASNKVVLNEETEKPVIMVTNYPLFFFTEKIAGNKFLVQNLLPPGVEPHGWEPTPRDLISLENADILIYNGAGLEDWIVNISRSLENKKLEIVDSSAGIELILNEENEHEHGENGHHDEEYDPHIWLDPNNAKKIVANLLATLVKNDPANKDFFTANAQQLVEQLENLDDAYREELQKSGKKVFVVNHAAFGYLAKRYDLQQVAVLGINPHVEPTPQKIADLVKLLKQHNLKYIFTETLVSSKVADVLARDAGIGTKVLNPLGNLTNEDLKAGKDYFSIMYENLAALKEGLN